MCCEQFHYSLYFPLLVCFVHYLCTSSCPCLSWPTDHRPEENKAVFSRPLCFLVWLTTMALLLLIQKTSLVPPSAITTPAQYPLFPFPVPGFGPARSLIESAFGTLKIALNRKEGSATIDRSTAMPPRVPENPHPEPNLPPHRREPSLQREADLGAVPGRTEPATRVGVACVV